MLTLINLPLINCFLEAKKGYTVRNENENFDKIFRLSLDIRELINFYN